jgi:hypothetical protein
MPSLPSCVTTPALFIKLPIRPKDALFNRNTLFQIKVLVYSNANVERMLLYVNVAIELAPGRMRCSVFFRVARWFIFKTKIPIRVNFAGPLIGKC